MTKLRHTFYKDRTTGVTFTTLANMFLSALSLTPSRFKPGSLSCTFRVLVNKRTQANLAKIRQQSSYCCGLTYFPTLAAYQQNSLKKFVKFINEVRRSPPQIVVRCHKSKMCRHKKNSLNNFIN